MNYIDEGMLEGLRISHNKELARYGIWAKNAKMSITEEKISIDGAIIDEINFNTLQNSGIKMLDIRKSKVRDIIFTKDIALNVHFGGITFADRIRSNSNFHGKFEFANCIFEQEVNFNEASFNDILFAYNTFKRAASFLHTIFGNTKNTTIINLSNTTFLDRVGFHNATFNQNIRFTNLTFKKELIFDRAEFNCNQAVFNITCEKRAHFIGTKFQNVAGFERCDFKKELGLMITHTKKIGFIETIFSDFIMKKEPLPNYMIFQKCVFLNKLDLKYCNFKEITFNTCAFKDNIYFNNSTFQDYADFHECEFEKTASFYEVTFYKTPSFSQAIFKGNLNIVNANLNFDFDDLESTIKHEHEDYNKNIEKNENKKSRDKFANDFRDSFRIFKNTLIKDNNLLDASNFHKYELYSKELELKHKGNKTIKEHIEKWQLYFYRKLCDHHTDLLLNLKWLIIAIGLFASLYFISRLIQDISILESLNPFGICFSIACAFIALILYWFGYIERLDFFASINAVITLWIICYKPQLIFGIANLLGNIKYHGFENFLITIYTIIIGLIIFSLQKTARKNSIVPN
ncbi:pentapeptide repeat-containing protein [Helicobacter trogontum]|uniref:Pentapeptide repeat-containing protein n=1 Tax=Helicobacter trogontum TaxID=50960 RepID=A0A4U8SFS0_9HELI|nr:pentapeptide repeat-containing protein [Helicobacter trogontum]TLD84877.1 hypothetical protein LS81_000440 [Helicobacter trogontum]